MKERAVLNDVETIKTPEDHLYMQACTLTIFITK